MLINERKAIRTNKVLLVPYCRHHVTTYHDWMKDPDIQAATASEPLSVSKEYSMQQSWRSDTDKLTFILCLAPTDGSKLPEYAAEIASMIGDVNMFVSVQYDDDGKPSLVGELEIMIATKDFQRRGLGRSALLTFILYVMKHESEIVKQYYGLTALGQDTKKFDYFAAKIKESNARSLTLFEQLGFVKTSSAPSFFGEFELRHRSLSVETAEKKLADCGIQDYCEVEYDLLNSEEQ